MLLVIYEALKRKFKETVYLHFVWAKKEYYFLKLSRL